MSELQLLVFSQLIESCFFSLGECIGESADFSANYRDLGYRFLETKTSVVSLRRRNR